ncbi:hypothetical protein D9M71_658830 [compost metagenome]
MKSYEALCNGVAPASPSAPLPMNTKLPGTCCRNAPKSSEIIIGITSAFTACSPTTLRAAATAISVFAGQFTVGANSWLYSNWQLAPCIWQIPSLISRMRFSSKRCTSGL